MKKLLRNSFLILFVLCLTEASSITYKWTQKSNFGGIARHRGSALVIGNKGYIGLGHINAVGNILFNDFWEYEPSSNTWTQKANFGGGFRYHTSSFTIGNKAYVGMGRDPNNVYHTDLWEFDPSTNSWTQMANMPGLPRRGAVSFAINGKGYIATGETKVSPYRTNDMWEYNPSNNQWVQKASMPTNGRNSAVGFSIGNIGYVGTGRLIGSPTWSTNDLWAYNPLNNQWTQMPNVGPTTRMEATAFVLDGKAYIGTGDNVSSGINYGDMWVFDPSLNTCTQTIDFAGTKRRYMLSFAIGDKGYAGTGTNGTNFDDFWEMGEYVVGVDEVEKDATVDIYPNPCKTTATISVDLTNGGSNVDYLFTLYNLSGKKVTEITSRSSEFIFNRAGILNGLYIYQISAENQLINSGKIVLD